MNVMVIGAGLIGITTAYFLRLNGCEVTVIERHDQAAREASFANGGLLTPSMPDPWNSPGVFWELLRSFGREDAAMLIRPEALLDLPIWGLSFLVHSANRHFQRSIIANTQLCGYSMKVFRQLKEEIPASAYCGLSRGTLKIFRTPSSMDRATEIAVKIAEYSVSHELVDPVSAIAIEPSLRAVKDRIVGGIFYPDDESGDALLFCRELEKLARRRGVRFLYRTEALGFNESRGKIKSVTTDRGDFTSDRFVIATGAHSPKLARHVGIRLPIKPCKGYSLTLPVNGWKEAPTVPVIDDGLHAAVTPLGDRVRVAGTAEFDKYNTEIKPERINNLYDLLHSIFPESDAYVDRSRGVSWAGFRPVPADGIPIMGKTGIPNLFLNTGHFHLGWTMAAGAGKAVADLIAGAYPELDLDSYAPR